VEELNRGIAAADTEAQRIELRFLRGACHHAVGLHRRAVEDYQQTLEAQDALGPAETASPDLVSFICLAFYQKEMALYARAHLDTPLLSFCVDADLHPEFKVGECVCVWVDVYAYVLWVGRRAGGFRRRGWGWRRVLRVAEMAGGGSCRDDGCAARCQCKHGAPPPCAEAVHPAAWGSAPGPGLRLCSGAALSLGSGGMLCMSSICLPAAVSFSLLPSP
jgi:hypothetical protein